MTSEKKPKQINRDQKKEDINALEKVDYKDKYKRALADYQNLLKQTAKEKMDFAKYANEQLIIDIIPVYNNLKIAIEHSSSDNVDSWLEGVKYVVKQFKNVLSELGVEEIETKNKKFDHEFMHAVEGMGEKVKKEISPGYKLNGKVIIPAKVIVE